MEGEGEMKEKENGEITWENKIKKKKKNQTSLEILCIIATA